MADRWEYCDLIMKGGITSGIVYPLAACELAQKYRFRNIGGASAGAIAAAATAAAELGRRRGSTTCYEKLAALPKQLGRDNFLLSLFRPSRTAAPIFALLIAGLAKKGRVTSIGRALLVNFGSSVIWGVLFGVVPVLMLALVRGGPGILYILLGLTWVLLGIVGFLVKDVLTTAGAALNENQLGLCSGFDPNSRPGEAPLINWLASFLDELAEQPAGKPLTFGDLQSAPAMPGEPPLEGSAINLEVMTTNLTHGRPYRIPFDSRVFYFDPMEWTALFGRDLVNWLVEHTEGDEEIATAQSGRQILPLPEMPDLPVVIAVRMSLSFPVLISAVPLYAVDRTRTRKPAVAERCWFSDGGITSNLPIHFFDSPLPRWPTFAINLKGPHPDYPEEKDFVWLPGNNNAGLHESWNRFDENQGWSKIIGFIGAILDTMHNWRDHIQFRTPGYRDRIVHISLNENEGGLNLNMPDHLIQTVSKRGQRAGQVLLTNFSLENHLWVRYRSIMDMLARTVKKFGSNYANPLPADEHVWSILKGESAGEPPSYKFKSAAQKEFAVRETRKLAEVGEEWSGSKESFENGAPKPTPELRITPRF